MSTSLAAAGAEPPSNAQRLLSEAAATIRGAVGRQLEQVIIAGAALRKVKQALPHGEFGKWIDAEFGWSERTAQNYMRAAETYGPNPHPVAHLPMRTLFRLQGPSVPADVRNEVFRLLDLGEAVTESRVGELIFDAAQKQKVARVEAALSADQRRRKKLAAQRQEKEDAARRAQWDKQEAAEKVAAQKAADLVLSSMPGDIAELIALLESSQTWRFLAALKEKGESLK